LITGGSHTQGVSNTNTLHPSAGLPGLSYHSHELIEVAIAILEFDIEIIPNPMVRRKDYTKAKPIFIFLFIVLLF
jgi:hypothetical protein